ncbi:hypothetical protein niasHT_000830 [Heterodera trifolii]|uniref:B30.2/SPRY domain-containing protein n=1 Tax=Heterodera trifolii TaxID=157864 RepID=A0ABD2MAK1_9BILA
MATFSVALFTTLIGIGLIASSVRADQQQNETENGGDIKHLFGTDGIRENQNAMAEKMSGIEAKLEQIENGMRDSQNLLSNKLENGICENLNALAKKMAGIEAKLEKLIENDKQNGLTKKIENGMPENQTAPALMKNMANSTLFHFTHPMYRWNASDCDPEIVVNERTNSIQSNSRSFHFCSCRAWPIQMPSSAAGRIGIIYTEYRILAKNRNIFIGLSTKAMPLYYVVGDYRVSYSYADYGMVRSKNADAIGHEVKITENLPRFGTGDVVGCGLNWATRQLFFTKNGQRLDIANLYVDEGTEDLYPTVTLLFHGDAVEANFGPNFKYDLSKKF